MIPLRWLASGFAGALLVFAVPPVLDGQSKRPLDHDDVLHWSQIEDERLSRDGRWLSYALTRMEGDPVLRIRDTDGLRPAYSDRGTGPMITADSRFVTFQAPPLDAIRDSLMHEGASGDELPGDSLVIVDLSVLPAGGGPDGEGVTRIGDVESFAVPEEGGPWLAYLIEPEDTTEPTEEVDEAEEAAPTESPAAERDDPTADRDKTDGKTLVLRHLPSGDERRFEYVKSYIFSTNGETLAFTTSSEDGTHDGAYVVSPGEPDVHTILEGEGEYSQLAVAEDGRRVAFLSNRDNWEAEQPEFLLYHAAAAEWSARALASSATDGVPEGWWVSENGTVTFSTSGHRIFLGTAPRPAPEPDEILEEDKVVVDVWNWKDPYLQPMQLVQAEEERDRAYDAVVHLGTGRLAQLATPDVPEIDYDEDRAADFALGQTDVPYRQLISWDGRYNDLYSVDLETGERRRVVEAVRGFRGGTISPEGRYATWWDGAEKRWMSVELSSGTVVDLTSSIDSGFDERLDDHPDEPPPYGAAGWTTGDEAFLVYDEHDIWRVDPDGGSPVNVTAGAGARMGTRYRYVRTDPDSQSIPEDRVIVSGFDLRARSSGLFRGHASRSMVPEPLLTGDAWYAFEARAADADRVLVSRQSYTEFPDLWVTDARYQSPRKLTDANPQQSEYAWGSAEIVTWTSNDGIPLEGILYKPEGFDRTETYPMMVYFYERSSDGLHRYRPPTPGGSSIAFPFYVSRGYLLFVPDIPYEIGYPGESALDAVVPGVLSLVDEGFVDADRIGVQGHSWGGYQIAYMLTKTNLFAAAEAGAPVSNMTSAYGGIRWGTGMSRMFQYERTQSRIGGTLWESTMEYLHNSPLFYVDKIHTPLLMMHNDEDTAVPWYQGIEMFVAMRRLQKPAWMLNYNGEPHGLRKDANRKDWAIRMQQFFDHYLKDAPAPVWMEEGVPAVLKGRDLGLELVAPEQVSERRRYSGM